jgi:hypothetical protein
MFAQCKACGVPKMIGKTHAWRDGCIVDKASGLANLCVYEVYNHNTFVEEMGKRMGLPLDPIIYNASVHASQGVIDDMLRPHPMLRKLVFSSPLYRLTERLICNLYKAIGAGGIDLCEHSKRRRAKAIISIPFNLTQCLAITAGALQAIDGVPYLHDIVKEGEPTEVDFIPSSGEYGDEEAYERLSTAELTPSTSLPSPAFTPCPKCGVPQKIGEMFSFDLQRGVVKERKGGGRVILGGVASFNALFREFERELGDSIDDITIVIEKESTKKNLADSGDVGKSWDKAELRDYLALYGTGILEEMEQDGDKVTFSVANVYVSPLIAGRLVGLWETGIKKRPPTNSPLRTTP